MDLPIATSQPTITPQFLSSAVLVAIGLIGLYGISRIAERWLVRIDPKEPPAAWPRVPLIGHILGSLFGGIGYLQWVSKKHASSGIFTMPMVNSRIYTVTTPALASQIQRAQKTLVFDPFVLEFTTRMVGLPPDVDQQYHKGFDSDDIEENLVLKMHETQLHMLAPGEGLDEMSKVQLGKMAESLERLQDGQNVQLFTWLRQTVTKSNMYAAYGPKNVVEQQPELEQAFWDFDAGVPFLLFGVAPALVAPKAYAGRERVKAALAEWVRRGDHKLASPWIQTRLRNGVAHGVSLEHSGRTELGMMFALLANALPTTFWIIAHAVSRYDLVAEIRAELENSGVVRIEDDRKTRSIRIGALRANCPLLYSVFREALRLYAPLASVRMVLDDTMIGSGDSQFLLKKGTMVQTAGSVIHTADAIWGPDVAQFNPHRFYRNVNGTVTAANGARDEGKEKSVHPAAFRAFGGGKSMCPGRHFAQMEIMGFTALLLLGWDVRPADGARGVLPPGKEKLINLGVLKPDGDMTVSVQRRKGLEDVVWRFEK